MHIPDGYLSPATCAALYAGATPFWYIALQRVRSALHTRLVPVLSFVAAFCFVIMMFNVPLPGGTTGHAVGVGVAAVLLGPWASILALSVALVIQAFLFGDGGITTAGANCFNIAVIGSIVAAAVYRGVAAGSSPGSRRRVIAAGLGGYAGINAAAVCTAVEFGIQPALYTDISGAPLYCPYPLSIALPAMMLGHLTVAGLAELFVTAGVVAFIQRTDPALLKPVAAHGPVTARPKAWAQPRPLWLVLAIAVMLTPFGILAAGDAWGEWSVTASAPAGMKQLSGVWIAPMRDYAPRWIRNESAGYVVCAALGAAVALVLSLGIGRVPPRRHADADVLLDQ